MTPLEQHKQALAEAIRSATHEIQDHPSILDEDEEIQIIIKAIAATPLPNRDEIIEAMARAMMPEWFGYENAEGEVAISNYPGHTKRYQDLARLYATDALTALSPFLAAMMRG